MNSIVLFSDMVGPKFQLYISTCPGDRPLEALAGRIEAGSLSIAYALNDNIVTRYEDETHVVLVLGHVIVGNEIRNGTAVAQACDGSIGRHCRDYNGLWLVVCYEKVSRRLHVINDRFASYPIYYSLDGGELRLSLNYGDIHDTVARTSRFDRFAAYEFLALRRLTGEKTYDPAIAYLRGATHLAYECAEGRLRLDPYWQPSFEKSSRTERELEGDLVTILEEAVRARLTDGKRYGVLLSGGVDSRAVLMMARAPVTAFTNCDWENNEYDVAGAVARMAGSAHVFVRRPRDYFGQQERIARKFTGGMYPLSEGGWILPEYAPAMYEQVDALLHGCGLDYLVGDNYVPHTSFGLGPYVLYTRRGRRPRRDLIADFLATISWRFKDFDFMEWFAPAARPRVAEALRASLSSVVSRGSAFTDDPTDLYLYLTIHNPSRHSMYFGPMMTRAYVDERCPGWDNAYFDFCLALPHRYRSNWSLYRRALARKYPEFMGLREANTNVAPRHSSLGIDARRMSHALACVVGLNRRRPRNSRSWPAMDEVPAPPLREKDAEVLLMDYLPELSRDTVRRVLSAPCETIGKNLLRTLVCFLEDHVASSQGGS